MNKLRNKSGFSLVEIIIVVIILGVLAALALPKFTSQIKVSKAAEAFTFLGNIKMAVNRCLAINDGDRDSCNEASELSVDLVSSDDNFDYTIEDGTAATEIKATATYQGDKSGDTIVSVIDVDTEVATITGTGDFVGVAKKN